MGSDQLLRDALAEYSAQTESIRQHCRTVLPVKTMSSFADAEDPYDYPDVYDVYGGNFDDAYQGGVEDGRKQMAIEILKLLSAT